MYLPNECRSKVWGLGKYWRYSLELPVLLTCAASALMQAYPAHGDSENIEVTAPSASKNQILIKEAKEKIALIEEDPGYYYAGAGGALHRIQDVRRMRAIIAQAEAVAETRQQSGTG